MEKKYRVLVVDDQYVARSFFEIHVEMTKKYELAASLSRAEQAIAWCAEHPVDLVIMDVMMKYGLSGLACARTIKQNNPQIRIILTTSAAEEQWIEKARSSGIESFWYKEIQAQPILEVMQRTMNGESIYPDQTPVIRVGNAVSTEFTEKETEVLRELTDGASNKEIAEKLGISERTVKMHITNMIQKTGFRSRLELAVKARTGGLVIPD